MESPLAPSSSADGTTSDAAPNSLPDQGTRGDFASRRFRYGLLLLSLFLTVTATAWFCWLQPPYPNVGDSPQGWKWWCYPREAYPGLRLPGLSAVGLTSICFRADHRTGCAVGGNGAIFMTADGGRTWSASDSGTSETLNAVFLPPADTHGWAVGYKGTILYTGDGGKSWNFQSASTASTLRSVGFDRDGHRGWAVGDAGVVLRTTDGGNNWELEVTGKTDLRAVFVSEDGQHGWVVGKGGTLVRLGEKEAAVSPLPAADGDYRSVWFSKNGLQGWVAGSAGTILVTSDGGRNWSTQTRFTEGVRTVCFAEDGQRGHAILDSGAVNFTTDGGKNWLPLPARLPFYSSAWFDADGIHGWSVGSGGKIQSTGDGGLSWNDETNGGGPSFDSVWVSPDGAQCWVTGIKGSILSTTDRGENWKEQSSGTDNKLHAIFFNDRGRQGWAVGEKGEVLSTTDGGASWTGLKTKPADNALFGVYFAADGQRGWAVGTSGTILRSTDGGKSWSVTHLPGKDLLLSVGFRPDGTHGWIATKEGRIFLTEDQGNRWTEYPPALPALDPGIEFFSRYTIRFLADGQRGWAVNIMGAIYRTEDTGRTWTAQTSPTTGRLVSLCLPAGGRLGWAASDAGEILNTTDGGAHWQARASGAGSLASVGFADDGSRGYAVGEKGVILTTANGGAPWKAVTLYRRSPAPVYYALLALSLVPAGFAVRRVRQPPPPPNGIANIYISDAALNAATAAGTELGVVAAGLASYIENPRTQAPLVIGITGPWGSGKSSLMGIVRDNLDTRGFQTAWFNAWHHQSEEHLFTALLASLRDKALPAWWSPRGVRVRWRLLRERCARLWPRLLLGVAGLVFIGTVVPTLGLDTDSIAGWTSLDKVLGALTLPAALLPVLAAWKVFSAFGVEPAKVAGLVRVPGVARTQAMTSMREQFARDFGEVARALQPAALTIFIDDLDRCRPDQMFVMLEAINFLASSGECYIVLGMEREVVLRCLEAKLQADGLDAPATTHPTGSRAELWLEKLVQLRLFISPIPRKEVEAIYDSSGGRAASRRSAADSDWDWFKRWMPTFMPTVLKALTVLVLVGAIAVGAHAVGQTLAAHLRRPPTETKQPAWISNLELAGKLNNADVSLHVGPLAGPHEEPTPAPSATPDPSLASTPTPPPTSNQMAPSMTPAQEAPVSWIGWIAAAGILVLVGLGVRSVVLIRNPAASTDSQSFVTTLNDFTPCIEAACKTPRAVKQLINRIRLYAMLLRHWVTALDTEGTEENVAGQEASLVILGILEKLCPAQLAEALRHPSAAEFRLQEFDPDLARFNDRAAEAIQILASSPKHGSFERLVRAIEMS